MVDNHNKTNKDKAMRFQGNSGRWMKAEFVTGLMTSILSHTVLSNSNTKLREFLILMYLFCNNHRTYKTVRSETHIKIDVYKDVYHSFSICYEYVGEQEVLLEILSGVNCPD